MCCSPLVGCVLKACVDKDMRGTGTTERWWNHRDRTLLFTNFELLLRSEFDRLGLSPELLMVSTWGLHQGVQRTPKPPIDTTFIPLRHLLFELFQFVTVGYWLLPPNPNS